MIFVNLKTYQQGKEAIKLVKQIQKVNKKAIICAQPTDIYSLNKNSKLKIYSQNSDFEYPGRNTGKIIPESIKLSGGKGVMINHSENPKKMKEIKKTIEHCHKIGLEVICCTSSLRQAKKISKLKPYAIAFEDPKLISTGKSITKYNPRKIKKFAKIITRNNHSIPVCGAGISSKKDIIQAKELGCRGVLIASAIAKNPNINKIKKILQ